MSFKGIFFLEEKLYFFLSGEPADMLLLSPEL